MFSSKAQKARRRAYDLQQGSSAKYANLKRLFDSDKSNNKEILSDAQSQDKMIGRKKTMDLIKKGEDSVVGSSKGIISKTISYDPTKVKNKKELEEIERARNLLRAGRDRSRSSSKFRELYEDRKANLNDTINMKAAGRNNIKWERKDAVEQSKINNPRRVRESIAKHEAKAAELRAKKEAGIRLKKNLKRGGIGALAVGGAVAAGIGAKKLMDNKKAEKEKEKAYSKVEQKEFGKVKAANKAAKKAWEKLNQHTVLVGPPTVHQFRKINASGLTLTKHELKGKIGAPIRNHEGKQVAEINLRPDKPVNHSINTKGINKYLRRDISYSPKSIMKTFKDDPKRGEFTRVRWDLVE